MKLKLLVVPLAAINMAACSTIVNGSNQTLAFNTGAVEGANCNLTGGSGFAVDETFTTPAEVKVPRSKKALQVACTKAGYRDGLKTVSSKVETTTGGNFLMGGFIGVGVDAATGAIFKYPETIFIPMSALNPVTN